MGSNSVKNIKIKFPNPHAHLRITGRKPTKYQMYLMKDVGGVAETRFRMGKVYVSMDGP